MGLNRVLCRLIECSRLMRRNKNGRRAPNGRRVSSLSFSGREFDIFSRPLHNLLSWITQVSEEPAEHLSMSIFFREMFHYFLFFFCSIPLSLFPSCVCVCVGLIVFQKKKKKKKKKKRDKKFPREILAMIVYYWRWFSNRLHFPPVQWQPPSWPPVSSSGWISNEAL